MNLKRGNKKPGWLGYMLHYDIALYDFMGILIKPTGHDGTPTRCDRQVRWDNLSGIWPSGWSTREQGFLSLELYSAKSLVNLIGSEDCTKNHKNLISSRQSYL